MNHPEEYRAIHCKCGHCKFQFDGFYSAGYFRLSTGQPVLDSLHYVESWKYIDQDRISQRYINDQRKRDGVKIPEPETTGDLAAKIVAIGNAILPEELAKVPTDLSRPVQERIDRRDVMIADLQGKLQVALSAMAILNDAVAHHLSDESYMGLIQEYENAKAFLDSMIDNPKVSIDGAVEAAIESAVARGIADWIESETREIITGLIADKVRLQGELDKAMARIENE